MDQPDRRARRHARRDRSRSRADRPLSSRRPRCSTRRRPRPGRPPPSASASPTTGCIMKGEHLQATGSFKARGMANKIATLPPDARERGVITLSAGNASAAFAWAGRAAGVPVTVVMPAGAVRSKVDACLGYGARVVLKGTHVGEAVLEMERLRDEEGLVFCHPFDDPAVIAGQRDGGAGAGRRPARCRRRRGRRGRRRADQRGRLGGEGAEAVGPRLRRGADRARTRSRSRWNATRWSRSARSPWPTALARRSPAPGRSRWRDATSTASCSSTTRRSWPGCGSSSSAASSWSSRPVRRRSRRSCQGGSRSSDGERVAVLLSGGNVDIGRLGELLAGAGRLPGATG